MSTTSDLERRVRGVLDSGAPSAPPDALLARVLSTTSHTRPRPAWLADLKEPPMRHSARVTVGSPTLRLVAIMALTLALALAAAGAVVAGASLLPSPAVPVPPPFGPATNGSLVYAKYGDIHVADTDGANPRALITGDTTDWSPWFSHDGRSLLFARGDMPSYALMLADADGSNVRQLLAPGEWNVEFMPDDQQVIGTLVVDGRRVLSMIDAATGQIRDLDVGDLDPNFFQAPRPSDGQEILFTAFTSSSVQEEGLYGIRPDGTGLRAIGALYSNERSTDPSDRWPIAFQNPALSPDGSTIAYWNWEPTDQGVNPSGPYLHLRDLTTGDDLPVPFAAEPYTGMVPHFSPDGTMVAFQGCASSQSQLCVGPVDGSEPSRPIGPVVNGGEFVSFDFSPDGTKVILTKDSGITIIDLETGEVTPVLLGVAPGGGANWAPTGWQRLAP